MSVLSTIGAVILLLIGSVGLVNDRAFDPGDYRLRFQHDNAVGATANATEFIARAAGYPRPQGWIIAGLICCLIVGVDRLRRAVDMARPWP